MAAQRIGIARATYQRLERGDPSVSAGSIVEALLIYGFDAQVLQLGDPDTDRVGLRLEEQLAQQKGKCRA
jgi:transcriptional regulator with XRE-family HTH domain